MLIPRGTALVGVLTFISTASAVHYETSESVNATAGETWMHFTYRTAYKKGGNIVPMTTTSSQVLADDPLPTLVYNCAQLPHLCNNVVSHPVHGAQNPRVVSI